MQLYNQSPTKNPRTKTVALLSFHHHLSLCQPHALHGLNLELIINLLRGRSLRAFKVSGASFIRSSKAGRGSGCHFLFLFS